MKISLVILLFLICFFPLNIIAECIRGDCMNGQGTYIDPRGHKYDGEFKDGKYRGQGVYTYPDGRKLVGRFRNHELSGNDSVSHLET